MIQPMELGLILLVLLHTSSCSDDQQLQGHLQAFGKQGTISGVDQVDGFLSPQEFFNNYAIPNKPLLFKGAAKLSPAYSAWTDQKLRERTPPRPLGDVFVEHNKKENRSQSSGFLHFNKFLDTYNTSDIYMVSDVPSFMLSDLVVPFPLQCQSFIQGGLDTHVMWFSSGGTSSVIHHDSYENINCLYRGRKTLVFLNTTKYPDQVKKIIDREDGAFSSVDVDKINLKDRPEFSGLEYQLAEMEAGDCLFIPWLWVHQVRSFENNLAVNIWWMPPKKYDLSNCSTSYDTSITFDKVSFKSLDLTAKKDGQNVLNSVAMNMKLENLNSEENFLKLVSEGNDQVSKDEQFMKAAKRLFKTMDLNSDGKINDSDLAIKLTIKAGKAIRDAANEYNIEVNRIREAANEKNEKLPKLFLTSITDDAFFADNRTWPVSADDDEEEEEDGDQGGKEEMRVKKDEL